VCEPSEGKGRLLKNPQHAAQRYAIVERDRYRRFAADLFKKVGLSRTWEGEAIKDLALGAGACHQFTRGVPAFKVNVEQRYLAYFVGAKLVGRIEVVCGKLLRHCFLPWAADCAMPFATQQKNATPRQSQ